jgi:hypothetical protein
MPIGRRQIVILVIFENGTTFWDFFLKDANLEKKIKEQSTGSASSVPSLAHPVEVRDGRWTPHRVICGTLVMHSSPALLCVADMCEDIFLH